MSINLKKGQKIDLRKSNPGLSAVRVGLGWDPVEQGGGGFLKSLFGSGKADIDCDASVFLLNGDSKPIDLIYLGNLRTRNDSIIHTGDNLTVRINIVDKKSYYLVEIKDTGKGIDKEDIENIWDKYYKKEKNHKRNVIGTGLGLSIVKNILENHKFTYGVKSIKNKGTTFYFEIPKRKEQKNFTITSHNLHN